MRSYKVVLFALVPLLLVPLLSGCAPSPPTLDSRIAEAAGKYRFHLLDWEFNVLAGKIFHRSSASDNETPRETLIERQVREAYGAQGIYNPLDRFFNLKVNFPPVDVYLAMPPNLLVVSPRDRIDKIRSVMLAPDMDEKEMEAIESSIDSLGYSSLVIGLGGIATFPSYIDDRAGMKHILETAAHEWMHLYLAFTPLGFRYVLDAAGIRQDYNIETMNETVADMVGREIGDVIYQKYYAPSSAATTAPEAATSSFDFNKEMREIRLAVDGYLAKGEIDTAEQYMETKRQYLAANGSYLRKLNQAYFAFYGTYADSPTSVNPIGTEMKQLREDSPSLKDFLKKVSAMTSRQDLSASVR
jgi:hypothetical protein